MNGSGLGNSSVGSDISAKRLLSNSSTFPVLERIDTPADLVTYRTKKRASSLSLYVSGFSSYKTVAMYALLYPRLCFSPRLMYLSTTLLAISTFPFSLIICFLSFIAQRASVNTLPANRVLCRYGTSRPLRQIVLLVYISPRYSVGINRGPQENGLLLTTCFRHTFLLFDLLFG